METPYQTMRLRFIDGKGQLVNWKNPPKGYPHSTFFGPEADIPVEFGERLLNNPESSGKFIRVDVPQAAAAIAFPPIEQKPQFACDVCGKEAGSKAGLGAHKRKHKEKKE